MCVFLCVWLHTHYAHIYAHIMHIYVQESVRVDVIYIYNFSVGVYRLYICNQYNYIWNYRYIKFYVKEFKLKDKKVSWAGSPHSCNDVSRGKEVWVTNELPEHQRRMSVKWCQCYSPIWISLLPPYWFGPRGLFSDCCSHNTRFSSFLLFWCHMLFFSCQFF